MSIETLLEAARFLEWEAQQQQKTRDEGEKRETLRLDWKEQEDRKPVLVALPAQTRVNHVTCGEEACPEHRPTPVPPPPPPPPVQVALIPVVTSPTALALSSVITLSSPGIESPQRLPLGPTVKVEPVTPPHSCSPKQQHQQHQLVQTYQSPIITASPHHLIHQPVPTQTQASHQLQSNAGGKLSSLEEARHLEQKRRPGGAGTREVHNKLEKNRRAHLKECFETLKRNIPNVDDKKTSNLSVLRSALRYIQTLKRKEKEYEHEMERLAREKISTQQRLAELKNELTQWMDVLEIERVLRQTVQPEDDQVSTSTASEGEDNFDQDIDDERPALPHSSLPKAPPRLQPELLKALPPSSILPPHISIQQHRPQQPSAAVAAPLQAQALVAPQAMMPTHTHIVQPTVIAHAAATASHASVIQAVNHAIQAGSKHIAHIAPSTSNSMQLTTTAQPIGHITVHPATLNHVTHLSHHLPTIYPQPMAVPQPTVMSHIAHTLSHAQVNGTAPSQQAASMVGKQAAVGAQVVTHHPQLVGQTVLNPVTMVTMPSFPVSTLKLA